MHKKIMCLLLDKTYKPFKFIDHQKAFLLDYTNRGTVLEYHPTKTINSTNYSFPIPIVIKVNALSKNFFKEIPSRYNIYIRDNYTCAYCGKFCSDKDITIDHIIPSSLGGKWTWENLVTACSYCNTKKSNSIAIPVYVKPYKPSYFNLVLKDILPKLEKETRDIISNYCENILSLKNYL